MALVAAAEDEQDGVSFLTAAFTGLRRGELAGQLTSMRLHCWSLRLIALGMTLSA
jgi:hypothetical protein